MRRSIIISLFIILTAHLTHAGNLNVINLTSEEPLQLALKREDGESPFSVEAHSSSGPFKLKNVSATLKTVSEDLPDLEIPKADGNRVAVLFPKGNAFEWHIYDSESKVDKWSFRVINLTTEAIDFSHQGKDLNIKEGEKIQIDVTGKKDLAFILDGGEQHIYRHVEPCAVIAFITKSEDKMIVTFIPDL